jgi:hypothetical protein
MLPPPSRFFTQAYRKDTVFDREGYSPDFLLEMRGRRIACLTYHKYPKEDWPEEEFKNYHAPFSNGNIIEMKLAERGTCLSGKVWVREIRVLPAGMRSGKNGEAKRRGWFRGRTCSPQPCRIGGRQQHRIKISDGSGSLGIVDG